MNTLLQSGELLGELFRRFGRFVIDNAMWIALGILLVRLLVGWFTRNDDGDGTEGGVAA